ncbi:MAG: TPR end-of-group domain-containing protein [Prochlorotrichaceae cyanobacterium]
MASYDEALKYKPDYASAWYNKSCCYALQNQLELALAHLQQAIKLDPQYRDMARSDSDFDGIRRDDRFQALINETE